MKNEHTGINTTPLITEAMLLAYVDGSLAEAQRLAVEARLDRDPEMAAKVAAYRAQNEALHALFDRHLAEPLDPVVAGLETELRKADSRKAGVPPRPSRKAWGAAALAASVALVWPSIAAARRPVPPLSPCSTFRHRRRRRRASCRRAVPCGCPLLASGRPIFPTSVCGLPANGSWAAPQRRLRII